MSNDEAAPPQQLTTKRRLSRVGVRLTVEEREHLQQLAHIRCTNPSQVLRSLLLWEVRRIHSKSITAPQGNVMEKHSENQVLHAK
jgi:hypothetical protein